MYVLPIMYMTRHYYEVVINQKKQWRTKTEYFLLDTHYF